MNLQCGGGAFISCVSESHRLEQTKKRKKERKKEEKKTLSLFGPIPERGSREEKWGGVTPVRVRSLAGRSGSASRAYRLKDHLRRRHPTTPERPSHSPAWSSPGILLGEAREMPVLPADFVARYLRSPAETREVVQEVREVE